MNKRILEIAERNGVIHNHMTTGERNDTLVKFEKFAELIVEECCKQLEKEQYEHFNINRVPRTFYNAALYDGILAIKKHFGVEE